MPAAWCRDYSLTSHSCALPAPIHLQAYAAHVSLCSQEYLGIAGNPDFCKLSAKLAFGANSKALKEGRAATVQSLSGTGSLRVCVAHFITILHVGCTKCHLPL